jgi:hypothetical protein
VRLHFAADAAEPPLELLHHLMLGVDERGVASRKPVLHELFEEVVLWEPTAAFAARLAAHVPRAAPPSALAQFHAKFNPGADYARVQHARARLAHVAAQARAALAALEGGGEAGGEAAAAAAR